jgi:hypothetical protein
MSQNPDNPNEDGLTFAQWQVQVDRHLVDICGLDRRMPRRLPVVRPLE